MIQKLDIDDPSIRAKIIELQRRSYLVEAQLIGYFMIPGLIEGDSELSQSDEVFYGYWQTEVLVGMISFKLDSGLLDIYRLVVCPDSFKKGIAAALISFVENLDLGFDQVVVGTAKANIPACRLYSKLGFECLSEMELEPGLTFVKFSKPLSKP